MFVGLLVLEESIITFESPQILHLMSHFSFSHISVNNRSSSRPEVFCKKGILRNFAKFTGKHLCRTLFFNIVAGLRPATLLKVRLWHRCFPMNFAIFLRIPFLTEHLRWLLLEQYMESLS